MVGGLHVYCFDAVATRRGIGSGAPKGVYMPWRDVIQCGVMLLGFCVVIFPVAGGLLEGVNAKT